MGILSWIFRRVLVRKLKKDSEFISAVKDVDKAKTDLQLAIKKAEKNGVVIPDAMKRSAGMEVDGKENKK